MRDSEGCSEGERYNVRDRQGEREVMGEIARDVARERGIT